MFERPFVSMLTPTEYRFLGDLRASVTGRSLDDILSAYPLELISDAIYRGLANLDTRINGLRISDDGTWELEQYEPRPGKPGTARATS